MEQKDYFMREIEKIGGLLRALIGRMIRRNEDSSISDDTSSSETKDLVIQQSGINLEFLATLNDLETNDYLLQFDGLNVDNIELLAELFYLSGLAENEQRREMFLKKALQLYEICKNKDKTFSFERENKITEIKKYVTI